MTPRSVPAGFHGAGREPSALQHQGEGCPGPSTALGDQKCAGDLWQGPHTCAQHLKCVPLCVGRVLPGAERAPALPGAWRPWFSARGLTGCLHARPLFSPSATSTAPTGPRHAGSSPRSTPCSSGPASASPPSPPSCRASCTGGGRAQGSGCFGFLPPQTVGTGPKSCVPLRC